MPAELKKLLDQYKGLDRSKAEELCGDIRDLHVQRYLEKTLI